MQITLFDVVLFLHIGVAIVAYAMAGVMHTSLQMVARGRTVGELRSWGRVMHRVEPLFPVMAVLLLGLGAWLVHLGHRTDDAFSFRDGWVLTAIVTLVVVEAMGGAILAPRGKKLTGLIDAAPDGPVTAEIRAGAADPMVWYAAHITTFGFLGVIFLMAAKPTGEWAWLFPTIGALVGVVVAGAQLRGLPTSDAAVPGQRRGVDAANKANA
jgi:hypothetical protein